MKKNNFEFLIASPFDKEKLICEIYYKEEMIAEISQENDQLLLEIYPSTNEKWWNLPLLEFQNVLEDAKIYLLQKGT